MGSTCMNGGCMGGACGLIGQPCCGGTTCSGAYAQCFAGTCNACGGDGELCCAGGGLGGGFCGAPFTCGMNFRCQ
jgi:hypothetical protein